MFNNFNSEFQRPKNRWVEIPLTVIPLVITIIAVTKGYVSYVCYAFAIWIFYLSFRLVKRKKITLLRLLLILNFAYFVVGSMFSIFPALAIKEFVLTHPTWDTSIIDNYSLNPYYRKTSRSSHPKTDVSYVYYFKNKEYKSSVSDPIDYDEYVFQFKSREELVAISKTATQKALDNHDYVLFVNTENPSESKLFLLNTWLNIKYSTPARLIIDSLSIASMGFLCFLVYILIFSRKAIFEFLKMKKR